MVIDGTRMLIALLIGIAILIVLVLKTKVQAFLALILTTVLVGIIGGMPLAATEVTNAAGAKATVSIVNSITGGFGGTLGSIGIIIGFGVMMGQIFEISGAAKRMAYTFLRLFGKGREEEALAITGFLVSIPIFCDSAFQVHQKVRYRPWRSSGCRTRYHSLAGTAHARPAGSLRNIRRRRR